ncbi:class I SAM-dependent methyltransferase [Chitinophaga nivalis]|uniref:Class I SAM-dependent methyltransferase n=1 Tax=Chitinophaga nivalis TaxID=2991709 RepID=A0ABT3IN28_9BACT|nr:class I SAM-dependent methyltransferase [Chitinophaga nivalis]MCW3464951.1 class I SAM-dependent methyltransferase [Chitinophaga nivalis]MCW3485357.1 class I SAM-dependent methyltransferase [Chitinophaga nivalis]
MSADRLYQDSSLVQFYDYDNPWSSDNEPYVHWAKGARRILDLGCGTGTLAVRLAKANNYIVATDVAAEMLAIAREKSDKVAWLQADARTLRLSEQFDFILLSGHVFQVFLTDEDREKLFQTIQHHLSDDGIFIFDSRNPLAEEWKQWDEATSQRYFNHPQLGSIRAWNSWEGNAAALTYTSYYAATATNKLWQARSVISFPSREKITSLLSAAGLQVNHIYGDWQLNEFRHDSEEMIFVGGRLKNKAD